MQRECNDVAFEELILITRLKQKYEIDTSAVRNQRFSRSMQLLNMSMYMISSTRGYCLHKPVHQLFEFEPCVGDFKLDKNSEMCQTS